MSTLEPRSPWWAKMVALYSAAAVVGTGAPPAIPHGSKTGARPGARHGLYLKTSCTELGSAPRLAVRYFGKSVGAIDCPGQWSKLAILEPLPSHRAHPIVQPCENQKVACPELHTEVPLVQGAFFLSIDPVGGCFPSLHGGSVESIELRAGGIIIDEWPSAHRGVATTRKPRTTTAVIGDKARTLAIVRRLPETFRCVTRDVPRLSICLSLRS
mmetsp:Transcript_17780/g.46411  ORF Transcript_17780/g.46411 Transcript_17780/m.46411 type:complete len:213 (+) Transcript_17780:943-1581(+)